MHTHILSGPSTIFSLQTLESHHWATQTLCIYMSVTIIHRINKTGVHHKPRSVSATTHSLQYSGAEVRLCAINGFSLFCYHWFEYVLTGMESDLSLHASTKSTGSIILIALLSYNPVTGYTHFLVCPTFQ